MQSFSRDANDQTMSLFRPYAYSNLHDFCFFSVLIDLPWQLVFIIFNKFNKSIDLLLASGTDKFGNLGQGKNGPGDFN